MSSSLILHKNNKLFLRLWDVMESGFYMTTGNDQLSSWTEKKLQNTSQSQSVSCSVVSNSLRPHGQWLTRLLCPWNSPGKSTGVGCHCLLQGIFPPRDQTWVSRIVTDSLPSELHLSFFFFLSKWYRDLAIFTLTIISCSTEIFIDLNV